MTKTKNVDFTRDGISVSMADPKAALKLHKALDKSAARLAKGRNRPLERGTPGQRETARRTRRGY